MTSVEHDYAHRVRLTIRDRKHLRLVGERRTSDMHLAVGYALGLFAASVLFALLLWWAR